MFFLIQERFKDWTSKTFPRIKEENIKNCHKVKYEERLKISQEFKKCKDFMSIKKILLNQELWQSPIGDDW